MKKCLVFFCLLYYVKVNVDTQLSENEVNFGVVKDGASKALIIVVKKIKVTWSPALA